MQKAKENARRAAAMRAGTGLPGRRQSRAEQMISARSPHLGDTADLFADMPRSGCQRKVAE